MSSRHPEEGRPTRLTVLLAWLPLIAAVVIMMTVTDGVSADGAKLAPETMRIMSNVLLIGGVLCLVGVVLGLRAVMRRSSGRLRAAWPFLVAAPAGVMMLLIWGLFFSAW